MTDTDIWDYEGGYQPLTACRRCGRVRPEYDDGYCLRCYIIVHPPQTTPDKDKDYGK